MRNSDVCPLPPSSTVWGYFRDSGGAGQERSVDQQRDEFHKYCQKFDLMPQEIFADAARQGDNADDRTQLNRMLDLIRTTFPQIHDRKKRETISAQINHGIVFWNFARLGRDSIESVAIRADLRMRGLILISLSDDMLTGNEKLDPILEALIDYKNQMDLEVIGRDAKRGIHASVAMRDTHPDFLRYNPDWESTGRFLAIFPGPIAPRGYKFEQICISVHRNGQPHEVQHLVPDEELWDRVFLAWKLRVVDRLSVPQIHQKTRLYSAVAGYGTFFRNRIYTGVFCLGDQVYGTPDDPFVPPAIPAEWYEMEIQRRSLRAARRKPGGTAQLGDIDPRVHSRGRLLSGLLVCSKCGTNMHATTEKDTIRSGTNKVRRARSYYQCGAAKRGKCSAASIGAVLLEQAVIEKLCRDVLDRDRLRVHADRLEVDINSHRRALLIELDALTSTLAQAKQRTTNILDALAERSTSALILQRLDTEEKNLHAIEREIASKQAELAYWASFEVDDSELERISARINEALSSGDTSRSRLAVSTFISKIEIDPGKFIRAKFYYTFPNPGNLDASADLSLPLRPAILNLRRHHVK